MEYTLYTYPKNPRAWKSLIVAEYAKIDIKIPDFVIGTDNKTPEYLSKFPSGKVPALDSPEGPLFESNAIARYIARKGNVLLGKSHYENTLIDQWIYFSSCQIEPLLFAWMYPVLGYLPFNQNEIENLKKEILKHLDVLNKHLEVNIYLVGDSLSLADIICAMTLLYGYTVLFDKEMRKSFKNVTKWFKMVINEPKVKNIIGEVKFVDKVNVKQNIHNG